ncbi:hypothetical protein PVAP13_9KG298232 [Panicum virgatum]|uniref:Uncharacterized protein n=1 Tax=Panicum virgatum TaxID=38727 RepID=A0A8T0NMM5_PANVG|nr:hypothetical protein PVAP13_9KG298232 [Panicum virgatum]
MHPRQLTSSYGTSEANPSKPDAHQIICIADLAPDPAPPLSSASSRAPCRIPLPPRRLPPTVARLCAHADGGFGRQLGLGQLQQRPQPRHRGDARAGRGPRRCSEGGAAGAWRTRPRNKNSGSTSSSLGSTATPAQGSDSVDRKPCHQPITDLTRDMLPHRASRRFGVN